MKKGMIVTILLVVVLACGGLFFVTSNDHVFYTNQNISFKLKADKDTYTAKDIERQLTDDIKVVKFINNGNTYNITLVQEKGNNNVGAYSVGLPGSKAFDFKIGSKFASRDKVVFDNK